MMLEDALVIIQATMRENNREVLYGGGFSLGLGGSLQYQPHSHSTILLFVMSLIVSSHFFHFPLLLLASPLN